MTETCEIISTFLFKYFLKKHEELYLFKPVLETNPKELLNHAKKLIKALELKDYIDVCLHEVTIKISGIQMEEQSTEMVHFSVKKDKEHEADAILGLLYIKLGKQYD